MALPFRDDHRTRATPWVTLALLAINVVAFLFVQPSGFQWSADPQSPADQAQFWRVQEAEEFAWRWGTVACELTTGELVSEQPAGCEGETTEFPPERKSIPLALLTCMFLHGDILHLAGNLLFLWVFGRMTEDRLGRANFLGLYVAGGIIATLGFTALNPTSAVPLIGASGAIAAVMGAYLVLFPRARVLVVIATAAFQVVYVPAAVVLALYFVTQFFIGEDNIAWEAHAVGMVAGAAAALVARKIPAVARRAELEEADDPLRLGARF
jgi:membrane associated rhomboid family serine protease